MTDLMLFTNKASLLINTQSLSKAATTARLRRAQLSESGFLHIFSKNWYNLMLKSALSQLMIIWAKMWLSTGKCMTILIQKVFSGLILMVLKCKKERLLIIKIKVLRCLETITQSIALLQWEIKLERKFKLQSWTIDHKVVQLTWVIKLISKSCNIEEQPPLIEL